MFQKELAHIFIKNVNRRIAEIRIETGLTQEKLAEKMDIDVRDLQRFENKRWMSLKTLYRFAVVLNRPIADFFKEPSSKISISKSNVRSQKNH